VDAPGTVAELQELVRTSEVVRIGGAGTKHALSRGMTVSTSALRGIVEYQPDEFTVTVQAGVPVNDLSALLAARGQYLPFDPPLGSRGATLGGSVAAGVSGPGRFRFGGVRDFVIAVEFVDGRGVLQRGGARVVKNAAGFDVPKLMVGSEGRLGVLTEITFKVLPRPLARATLVVDFVAASDAAAALKRLSSAPFDLESLDWVPPTRLAIRLGGRPASLEPRLARVAAFAGGAWTRLDDADDVEYWRAATELRWLPAGSSWMAAAVRPSALVPIEAMLAEANLSHLPRRYLAGGHLLWAGAASPLETHALAAVLASQACPCRLLVGEPIAGVDGATASSRPGPFAERLRAAFDPDGRFAAPPPDAAGEAR
jgi:glycolate oxidase FAD binding subunit